MDDKRITQALRYVWDVKQDKIKNIDELIREMDFLGYRDVAQWARENVPRFENWLISLGLSWQTYVQDQGDSEDDN